jgi:hypothetical protein
MSALASTRIPTNRAGDKTRTNRMYSTVWYLLLVAFPTHCFD